MMTVLTKKFRNYTTPPLPHYYRIQQLFPSLIMESGLSACQSSVVLLYCKERF